MRWSPLDIEGKKFPGALLGYNRRSVEEFLRDLARTVEILIDENENLKQRLADFERIKAQLEETLVMAKKMAEDYIENARREAELRLREKSEALRALENDIVRLEASRKACLREFRVLLQSYLASLPEDVPQGEAKEASKQE
ncbi:MAG: DivIVA domain-containing protein [bacterium JZ-2024 1]